MANTLGGINLAQIADKTIAYLKYEFFPITAFATDFSEDVKDKGESVTTRIVSSVTASDLSSGYTPSDVTSTAVKVDLDQFFGPVVEFTDKEMSYAGDPEWLRQQFVEPMVEGLLDKIMQTAFALVVNANFTNNDVIAAANFDSDDVATIRGKLTKLKVSQKNRAMILDPDWYTALIKDSVVEDASAFGNNDVEVLNMEAIRGNRTEANSLARRMDSRERHQGMIAAVATLGLSVLAAILMQLLSDGSALAAPPESGAGGSA